MVVLDTDRGLRRSRIAGLRDPAAVDAGEVLARAGIDAGRVVFDWEPYVSLDPQIVMARATARLAVPAGITLALRDDTLVATGSATASWVAQAMTAAIPGVGTIDVGGVAPLFPDGIARLRRQIEDRRIRFATGSATVSDATAPVSGIATAFLQLEAAAAGVGYRATLRLVGRTDATGGAESNRELSRDRANAVRDALVARGVARYTMEPVGVGSSQPLLADDMREAARLNRSVSFEVRLTPAADARGGLR